MANLYKEILTVSSLRVKTEMRTAQKEWLRQREICEHDDCLATLYKGRIATFIALQNEDIRNLCEQRSICDTVRVSTAGMDGAGNSLEIIHLCGLDKDHLVESFKDDEGHHYSSLESDCGFSQRQEYWLMVQREGKLISKQFLMQGGPADRELARAIGSGLFPGEGVHIMVRNNSFVLENNGLFTMGHCGTKRSTSLQLSPFQIKEACTKPRGNCAPDNPDFEGIALGCHAPSGDPAINSQTPIFKCDGYWNCDWNPDVIQSDLNR